MTKEEAMGRIKARFDKWALDDEDMKAIQTLIPELKQSEDEKIRQALIRFFKHTHNWVNLKYDGDEIVAYLEKQKEQKPAEWTPTKEQMVALNWAANGVDNKSPVAGDIKASLRSLYNDIQSKLIKQAEWSEEDELFLGVCKNALTKYERSDMWDARIISEWLENRLKSFRPMPKQEQPEVDLGKFDKDVTKIWGRCAAEPNDSIACLHIETFNEVARHFYELGLNTRKGD